MSLTKTEIRNLNLSYYGIIKYTKGYNLLNILLPLETLNYAIELCLFDDEDLDKLDESRTYVGNNITRDLYNKKLAVVHSCYINEKEEITDNFDDSICFVITANESVYYDLNLKENDYVKITPELIIKNQVLWLEKLKISDKLVSKFLVSITGCTAIKNVLVVNIPIPNDIAKVHNITTNSIFKISEILCIVKENITANSFDSNKTCKYFIEIPEKILINADIINEENLIVTLTNKTIEIGKVK